jgi:predicted dehydrogenase
MTIFSEIAGNLTDAQLSFPDDKMDGHHREIHVFADAVLQHKPSPVPPEQSLNVMRILDGFYRSHAQGKEVKV